MNPFRRKKREESRERKAAGAPWAPGAGAASGTAELGTGAAPILMAPVSPGVGASGQGLLQLLARSTGLSNVLATKAGIAAVLLTGATFMVGLSLLVNGGGSSAGPSYGGRVFSNPDEPDGPSLTPVRGAQEEAAVTDVSSLEMFATANAVKDLDATPAEGPTAQVAQAQAPAKPAGVAAALPTQPKGEHPPPPQVGKLKAAKNPAAAGAASTQVAPLKSSLSGGIGTKFQNIYRPPKAGMGQADGFDPSRGSRPGYGLNKKRAPIRSGRDAMDQAKFANRMSASGARMGTANAAAYTAGRAFDANNAAVAASNLGNTMGNGPAGLGAGGPGAMDVKNIGLPPPPPDVKDPENKTPYQNLIYAGMAALMLGQMLVQAAGMLVGQGQKTMNPGLINAGKAAAVAAMGAGGGAMGIGGQLAGQYDQMTQAIPFVMGGGVIMAQAAMVLLTAEQAGQQAESGVSSAANGAADTSGQMLQPMMPPMMPPQNNEEEDKPEPPKPKPRVDVNKDYSHGMPGSTGSLKDPGQMPGLGGNSGTIGGSDTTQ